MVEHVFNEHKTLMSSDHSVRVTPIIDPAIQVGRPDVCA